MDLDVDIQLFLRTVDLVGSEDLLSDSSKRFFIGRAVSYASAFTSANDIVDTVHDKIKESIRHYYYKEDNTSDIEARIMDDWIIMARSFKEQLRPYVTENGRHNGKILSLKKYNDAGEVEVIVAEMENERDEARGYLRKRPY